jgi:hypothetical protein
MLAVDVLAGRVENLGKDSRGEPKDAFPVTTTSNRDAKRKRPALLQGSTIASCHEPRSGVIKDELAQQQLNLWADSSGGVWPHG